jgi:hypothetical protein
MKAVFLIERSPDVFHTVKSYLRESSLPFACFQSVDEAILAKDLPLIIILFGSSGYEEVRQDLTTLKNNPSYVRVPKILILPFASSTPETALEPLDLQGVFSIPVERLRFQALIAKFLRQAHRRVFRILVTIQKEESNVRHSGISIDFSESGMAFECVSDFQMGEKLIVSFVNPRTETRFLLKAEIVRKKSTPVGNSVFYGVLFRQLSEKEAEDLSAFISGGA